MSPTGLGASVPFSYRFPAVSLPFPYYFPTIAVYSAGVPAWLVDGTEAVILVLDPVADSRTIADDVLRRGSHDTEATQEGGSHKWSRLCREQINIG